MIEFVRGIVVHGTTESADKLTVPSVIIAILKMLLRAVSSSLDTAFLFVSSVLDSSLTLIIEIVCTERIFLAFTVLVSILRPLLNGSLQVLTEIRLSVISRNDFFMTFVRPVRINDSPKNTGQVNGNTKCDPLLGTFIQVMNKGIEMEE